MNKQHYGVAPKSKADYAFLLHELHHLKPDGILTIVLPHGVLFRGGEEEQIRTNLIEKNNIDAIICEGIDNTLRSVLSALESEALALSEKYATSYKQINDDMVAANEELAGLVEQLTGDEFAIRGLKELVKE